MEKEEINWTFEEAVIVIENKPRTYIQWYEPHNTLIGEKVHMKYERRDFGCGLISYINSYNNRISIEEGKFFDALENLYQTNKKYYGTKI